ncbi:chorismate-binding protein [Maribacter litopenaei]|uniref:Chorismate-binding protein n=1 Tax=Maribacter litopenaei TaxID=2976127 RepID=A0ABY5YCT0_9FLAO|nr:chorismate-binding protein [Maribacter litopenaei]UWX56132.1 chorismate-binding protein [Maribacter litopenaei]
MVTDYILEALRGKTTDLKIGNLETTMAGQLWHLRTKISGHFELGKLAELIKSLHPTPAVCGIPKEKAKTFILENEQYDRMFYTGYLGELNLRSGVERNTNPRNKENGVYRSILNSTELFVNLRCMKLDDPLATLFIGGGITSDSDPRKEWEETENKSKTILKVITD